jgi:branched-subunit amino acid transport protein
MSRQFSFQRIFVGTVAGLLSAPVCLILAYLVGFGAIAVTTRDLFATLLAAFTFLPIMLALVLAIPTLVIALLTGLTLGLFANFTNRFSGLVASLIGFVLAELVLSLVLPLIVVPQERDLVSIISNYSLSGIYGIILGFITSRFFLRLSIKSTSQKVGQLGST